MTTTNHWGKWVDSETPITGVHSIHDINWSFFDYDDKICLVCLDCEEIYKIIDEEYEETGEDYDYCDCDSSHTKLIGNWLKDPKTNQYEPVRGDTEFAAILNETTIQVVWSKYTERHALCSPCFPGQADADSDGEFLCYVLPPDLLYRP